jgi:hypothetical protein
MNLLPTCVSSFLSKIDYQHFVGCTITNYGHINFGSAAFGISQNALLLNYGTMNVTSTTDVIIKRYNSLAYVYNYGTMNVNMPAGKM